MKNIKYILLILTAVFFTACEKVVDVDLDTAAPRLVVDASINWLKGTDGSQQKIKLTTTTGYYSKDIPIVSGATVFITNTTTNTVFNFTETAGTGEYFCNNFLPVINNTYVLTVMHNGETYNATEKLYAVPKISRVIQDNEGGFLNEDIEIRFFFMDNPAENNFYLIRYDTDVLPYADYNVLDDEFFQGNEMFDFIDNEDFKAGDVVGLNLYGISERYNNYMSIVISMVEGGAGSGPFQTPPVNVRGNMVNQTNSKNFAYGYFRLSESDKLEYTIQ
ncbi:DUF4249 family protein [Flavobacterium cerinum]|uniref:DUF4249 domain-containing protein n=1 Tax=Flavobacterium cerinum TaxID=2502784 RepID=A0A3S3SFV3_9FLAO|nr:DUF4249 family protein [Flavobacterium cerinum]RWX01630.1 DUF4249 domain-containing protein [Flavobacterium cerinum]